MKYLLPNNRSKFNQNYNSGLSSSIYLPLNIGRYVGPDNTSLFKTKPDNDSVNLAEWITNQIALGNIDTTPGLDDTIVTTTDVQTITGTKTMSVVNIDTASISNLGLNYTFSIKTGATVNLTADNNAYSVSAIINPVNVEMPATTIDGLTIFVDVVNLDNPVNFKFSAGNGVGGGATTGTVQQKGLYIMTYKASLDSWFFMSNSGYVLLSF